MRAYLYDEKVAQNYDIMEGVANAGKLNEQVNKTLKDFKAKSIWDITCGTGSQAIYLHRKGYKVTASDISKKMLGVARIKYPKLQFKQADMRTASLGKFDAIISMFNAIGHLTKPEFESALRNMHRSLKSSGIYVFDIFNLEFMKNGGFIGHEFIDTAEDVGGTKYVRFNNNRLDVKNGRMLMNQRTIIQEGHKKPVTSREEWVMQIYSFGELKSVLERNGFKVVSVSTLDGGKFNRTKSTAMMIVSKKA